MIKTVIWEVEPLWIINLNRKDRNTYTGASKLFLEKARQ